ncbi:carbohydrate ABC transporter permease [Dactylosporangium sp. CA-092794]|uniref:carbohydrate ABC transporter permease n=1 Tax=Dactylosporangium sp. CA-092794 TaxID=3239929 RepID=UPI003D8A28DB
MRSSPVAGRRRMSPQARAAWLFLAPSLAVLGAFSLYPMLRAGYLSFTSYNLLGSPDWVGLRNYRQLLHDPDAGRALLNTLYYSVVTTVLSVLLALFVAVILNRKFAMQAFARTAIFLPFIVSTGIISLAWTYLLNPQVGLLTQWLAHLGLAPAQGFLQTPGWAMPAVIAVGVWKNLGFYVVMYLAGLQSVPRELYEAAETDGAGPIRRFFRITWPLLANQTMLVAIIATINNVQVFDQIYVMTNGGPIHSTETLVMLLYHDGFTQLQFGYASALSWVLMAVMFVLTLGQFFYFRRRAVSY